MTTRFTNTLHPTSGQDYTSWSSWESQTQIDLTAATTMVFSHSGATGLALSDGDSVIGGTSEATANVVAVVTATQILVESISGVFQSGERMELSSDSGRYVTLSDDGDDPIVVLECYANATFLDEDLHISGATQDATNYREVRAADGERHDGTPGSGFQARYTGGSSVEVIEVDDDFTRLIGLDVLNTGAASGTHGIRVDGEDCLIDSCLAKGGSSSAAIACNNVGRYRNVWRNCVAYGTAKGFFAGNFDEPFWYNCTAANNTNGVGYGFERSGTGGSGVTAVNCVAFGNTDDWVGSDFRNSSHNASSDAVNPPGTDVVSTGIVSGDFEDEASDDYRLASGSSLIDEGTTIVSFSEDFIGTTRSDWDVGAHEFAAGGITVSIGQATETDTSFSISHSKTFDLGLSSESDSAFSVSLSTQIPVGITSETDTAFAALINRLYDIGLASETDSSFNTLLDRAYALGIATSTDSAFLLTLSRSIAVALASETETSFAQSFSKLFDIGIASDTETSFDVAIGAGTQVGQAEEVDSALSVLLSINISTGLSVETDSAFAAALNRAYVVSQAQETDSAFTSGILKAFLVGQASETDSALAIAGEKNIPVGLSSETDTAQSVALASGLVLGISQETDSSFSLNIQHLLSLGLSTEADSSFSTIPMKLLVLGQSEELDAANAVDYAKALNINLAEETDSASIFAAFAIQNELLLVIVSS